MDINVDQSYNISRLQKWLEYEIAGSTLFLASLFLGVIFIFIIIAAALIFIPFMLKILFEEKRYGWIIFFFVMVCLPLVIAFNLKIDGSLKYGLLQIPLALFYFYCFLLRIALNDRSEFKSKNNKGEEIKKLLDKE